jgi:hypothetical protein
MRKSRIFVTVILVHLTFVVWVLMGHDHKAPQPRKHLVVKTVSPRTPEVKAPSQKSNPVPKKSPAASSTKKNNAQKPKAPPPAPKKPAPQKKQPSKKPSIQPVKKAQALVEELEERIAKIEQKRDKIETKQELKAPGTIDSLQIESIKKTDPQDNASNEISEDAYQNMLIGCLRQSLNLPDYGEVKIQLTLRADGSVAELIVIKSESQKNKRYLEEKLPLVKFPLLQGALFGKKQHTFLLIFCNEV